MKMKCSINKKKHLRQGEADVIPWALLTGHLTCSLSTPLASSLRTPLLLFAERVMPCPLLLCASVSSSVKWGFVSGHSGRFLLVLLLWGPQVRDRTLYPALISEKRKLSSEGPGTMCKPWLWQGQEITGVCMSRLRGFADFSPSEPGWLWWRRCSGRWVWPDSPNPGLEVGGSLGHTLSLTACHLSPLTHLAA